MAGTANYHSAGSRAPGTGPKPRLILPWKAYVTMDLCYNRTMNTDKRLDTLAIVFIVVTGLAIANAATAAFYLVNGEAANAAAFGITALTFAFLSGFSALILRNDSRR